MTIQMMRTCSISTSLLRCNQRSIHPVIEKCRLIFPQKTPYRGEFSTTTTNRPDPFARRPNNKCDPYGQKGIPMPKSEAEKLQTTIDSEWNIEFELDTPKAISRSFSHPDFLSGSKFLQKVAAVAQINNHYPKLELDRRIIQKQWQVITRISCHTTVLNGISAHDFHLAMVRTNFDGKPSQFFFSW